MNWLLGVIGGVVGGMVGYFAYDWMLAQGFYALVLPGAFFGIGCGISSRVHSTALGVFAGIMAILLGLLVEWKTFPFASDGSLSYFLRNIHHLQPVTWIMILLGSFLSFHFGQGSRDHGVSNATQSASTQD